MQISRIDSSSGAGKTVRLPSSTGAAVSRVRLLAVGGCLLVGGGCATPKVAFVRSERATFNAIAPEYAAYVAADPALNGDQRDRRMRTLRTWDLSLRQQENQEARP